MDSVYLDLDIVRMRECFNNAIKRLLCAAGEKHYYISILIKSERLEKIPTKITQQLALNSVDSMIELLVTGISDDEPEHVYYGILSSIALKDSLMIIKDNDLAILLDMADSVRLHKNRRIK